MADERPWTRADPAQVPTELKEPAREVGQPTPWQAQRNEDERTGALPTGLDARYHRHFASGEVHRDGGPECTQPGTPRRVYVFDDDVLTEHEKIVARYAAAHPEQFLPEPDAAAYVDLMLSVLGGEDAEFLVFTALGENKVKLSCPVCQRWGYSVSQSPLWELMADAREHWDTAHQNPAGA
jgi:hypothetical protein